MCICQCKVEEDEHGFQDLGMKQVQVRCKALTAVGLEVIYCTQTKQKEHR